MPLFQSGLGSASSNKTLATVTYTYIGLNDLGNQLNKVSLEKMYSRQLLDWQEEINNYLDRQPIPLL